MQGFWCKPGWVPEEGQRIPGTRCRRCRFSGRANHPKGHTPRSTLAVLMLSLPPARVGSALGNLLLLVNGFVHGRPGLGANLPRAGAAVRDKFSAALAYPFALLQRLPSTDLDRSL